MLNHLTRPINSSATYCFIMECQAASASSQKLLYSLSHFLTVKHCEIDKNFHAVSVHENILKFILNITISRIFVIEHAAQASTAYLKLHTGTKT